MKSIPTSPPSTSGGRLWVFMDTSSWTPLCTNISSTIQSYSRLRASIYNGGSNVGIEPGLPGMNSSLKERRLRYYRNTTAVLSNRRYLPVVPVPYRILGKKFSWLSVSFSMQYQCIRWRCMQDLDAPGGFNTSSHVKQKLKILWKRE